MTMITRYKSNRKKEGEGKRFPPGFLALTASKFTWTEKQSWQKALDAWVLINLAEAVLQTNSWVLEIGKDSPENWPDS